MSASVSAEPNRSFLTSRRQPSTLGSIFADPRNNTLDSFSKLLLENKLQFPEHRELKWRGELQVLRVGGWVEVAFESHIVTHATQ